MAERVDLNIGCGPFRAPEPWVNLDVHDGDTVHPDVVVKDPLFPLAEWEDGSVDRVYMGHVLEHVPWPGVDSFFRDIQRAMRPGGQVCVVGPDLLRTLTRWKVDMEPWSLVLSVAEENVPQEDLEALSGAPSWERSWPESSHKWNCHEARVVWAMQASGWVDVEPQPLHPEVLGQWPVVAYVQWQCAVTARCPE